MTEHPLHPTSPRVCFVAQRAVPVVFPSREATLWCHCPVQDSPWSRVQPARDSSRLSAGLIPQPSALHRRATSRRVLEHFGHPWPRRAARTWDYKKQELLFSPPTKLLQAHLAHRGCVHRGTGCHLRSLLGTLHCPHCPPTTGAVVARGCTGTACHPLPHRAAATSCCSCLGLLTQHAWELGGSPQKASTGGARIWVCLGQHSDRHDRWHRCCDPGDEMRRMPGMPAPWLGKTGRPQPSESSKTHPAEQHLCPAVFAPVFFSCPTWR